MVEVTLPACHELADMPPFIRLARPLFTADALDSMMALLGSGNLTNMGDSALVRQFEDLIGERVGRNVAAVSSGTAALHLAFLTLRESLPVQAGVAVPSYTFAASAGAIVHAGLRPVLCDVDPVSCNITAEALQQAAECGAQGVLLVDQFGLTVDKGQLGDLLCEFIVVEDAACALGGCDSSGTPAGTIAPIGIYSFHPRKPVTAAEGGAVTAEDEGIVAAVRRLRNHGTVGRGDNRDFAEPGLNYRMSEIHAVLGLDQLRSLDERLVRRRMLARMLTEAIEDIPWITTAGQGADASSHTYSSYAITSDTVLAEDIVGALRSRSIEAVRPCFPLHRSTAYSSYAASSMPISDWLWEHVVALPVHEAMDYKELSRVIEALQSVRISRP
jgi:dTDP-4-amino-4,6-dideoxygalactose transaminase